MAASLQSEKSCIVVTNNGIVEVTFHSLDGNIPARDSGVRRNGHPATGHNHGVGYPHATGGMCVGRNGMYGRRREDGSMLIVHGHRW